jgi:hypothetical protein
VVGFRAKNGSAGAAQRGPSFAICRREDYIMAIEHVRRLAAVLLVLLTVACSSDPASNPVGPGGGTGTGVGGDPLISNSTDDFRWQLSGAANFSTNGGYRWQNTGAAAKVTLSNSISSGSGTMVVLDNLSRTVWSGSLSNNGTFNTAAGDPGDWRIEVLPSGVSGNLDLRVQKN